MRFDLVITSRGSLLPDPRYDEVRCIILAAANDGDGISDGMFPAQVLISSTSKVGEHSTAATRNCTFKLFQTEKELLEGFVESVDILDPDIIMGFEAQQESIGYLSDRANTVGLNLLRLISRVPGVREAIICLEFPPNLAFIPSDPSKS